MRDTYSLRDVFSSLMDLCKPGGIGNISFLFYRRQVPLFNILDNLV